MKKFFRRLWVMPLFSTGAQASRSWPRKLGFWAWNVLWMLAAACGLTFCSLVLATGPYDIMIMKGYFETPLILLLNFLPVLLLLLLFWCAVGRSWIAFLVTSVIIVGGSAGNYFKLTFRDDPVMFADLLVLKEAGTISVEAGYDLSLNLTTAFCLAAVLAGGLFLFLFVRGRPRLLVRIGGIAAVLLACVLLAQTYLSDTVYNKTTNYKYLKSQWAATQQYISRGFVYPFLHSVSDAFPAPPEHYDKNLAKETLAQYTDSDIPEGEKVNVIAIMLEAFADFSDYEAIRFTANPYELYDQLAAESFTGTLTTDIFAGGTIRSERAFLAGTSYLEDFRSKVDSYVWYFREQGYQTSGDHPCYQWFYNRQNVNAYLGFEKYRFVENHYTRFTNGNVALDRIFFPEYLAWCQQAMEGDQPLFSFSVTYQGHGPYSAASTNWGPLGSYVSTEAGYTEETLYILENYFGSIANTMQHLTEFVTALRSSEEPVVLVLFGDHKPWLGNGNSVYTELGINLDLGTADGFHNYYDTPYLIWANDAAREALDNDFSGSGPNISPCFLMNVLFDQCGWKGDAYMQAVYDCWQALPVMHTSDRYVTASGQVTQSLSEEERTLAERFAMLEYYRIRN